MFVTFALFDGFLQGVGGCGCEGCERARPGPEATAQRAQEMKQDDHIATFTDVVCQPYTLATLAYAAEIRKSADPDLACHFAAALRLSLAIASIRTVSAFGADLLQEMQKMRKIMVQMGQ